MSEFKPKPITQEIDDTPKLLMLKDYQASRPKYSMVNIIPSATRWVTSDGKDTINLVNGVKIAVPANVASFLLSSNQAAEAQ